MFDVFLFLIIFGFIFAWGIKLVSENRRKSKKENVLDILTNEFETGNEEQITLRQEDLDGIWKYCDGDEDEFERRVNLHKEAIKTYQSSLKTIEINEQNTEVQLKAFHEELALKEKFSIPIGKTWGEIITELTGGSNLVNGKQAWALALDTQARNDLTSMIDACAAGVRTMELVGESPPPYPWERAAILFRKQKLYEEEIKICKFYIDLLEKFYETTWGKQYSDIRKGPRYEKIVYRMGRAKELLDKKNKK